MAEVGLEISERTVSRLSVGLTGRLERGERVAPIGREDVPVSGGRVTIES
jgi:hypothetical protein